ncbi:hypothetical protein [Cohaesibacter intestini]|uniref:hypothetical protein n=1 Tax=Cohaesibacter intestini TaxID=2211145 RepID=UPI00130069DB|nr:hypothetical protein [Cohaesibacter intestini]
MFAGVMGLFLASTMPASAYFDAGTGHRATMKTLKMFKKKNLIPTSMKCVNPKSAGKFLKPEVTFTTAPNKDHRLWHVFAYFGQANWKPTDKRLKLKYSVKLTARNSGQAFFCALYLGPKAGH